MVWIAARLAALFHEKWVCASHMPGISVAPAASIAVAPAGASAALLRLTWRMRLPATSTLPP